MDSNTHETHPLQRHQNHDQNHDRDHDHDHDPMDTSIGLSQVDAPQAMHGESQSNEPAPAPRDAQAVLERPRDEEGRASVVDRSGKILNRPSLVVLLLHI